MKGVVGSDLTNCVQRKQAERNRERAATAAPAVTYVRRSYPPRRRGKPAQALQSGGGGGNLFNRVEKKKWEDNNAATAVLDN